MYVSGDGAPNKETLMLKESVDTKGSKQTQYKIQLKSACEELLSKVRKFQDRFPVIVAVVEQEGWGAK